LGRAFKSSNEATISLRARQKKPQQRSSTKEVDMPPKFLSGGPKAQKASWSGATGHEAPRGEKLEGGGTEIPIRWRFSYAPAALDEEIRSYQAVHIAKNNGGGERDGTCLNGESKKHRRTTGTWL